MSFQRNFQPGGWWARYILTFEALAYAVDASSIVRHAVENLRYRISVEASQGNELHAMAIRRNLWTAVQLWPSPDPLLAMGITITVVYGTPKLQTRSDAIAA